MRCRGIAIYPEVAMSKISTAVAILLALAIAAPVIGADTVILKSGSRVEGEAVRDGDSVRVRTEMGSFEIDASRVASIVRDRRAKAESKDVTVINTTGRAKSTETGLDKKISVDFEDAQLSQVLRELHERSGVNIIYKMSEVEETPTLALSLEDVSVRQVLESAVEMADLHWSVQGRLVRVGTRETCVASSRRVASRTLRVYYIQDQLLSIRDHAPMRSRSLVEQDRCEGSGGCDDVALGAAFGAEGEDSWGFDDAEQEDDDYGEAGQTLSARADDFAVLITRTVRPNTWGSSVGAVGPTRREDEDDDVNIWENQDNVW
jgi:hypothetical protein